MEIYIYIDGSDFEEVAADISSSIEAWLAESSAQAVLVNQKNDSGLSDWELGINIKITKGKKLKKPLDFLYGLAKEHKCDFVLGIFDGETQDKEDICFFGNEEGRPDVHEISSYLGVKM